MNGKTPLYVIVWLIMVAGTVWQLVILRTYGGTGAGDMGIVAIAVAEVLLSAGFYWNLRYETKILSLFPLIAIVTIAVFMIAAILSIGM